MNVTVSPARPSLRGGILLNQPVLVAALLAAAGGALSLLAFPTGYAGADDFNYLRAAMRWAADGVQVARDHWQARLPFVLPLALVLRSPLPPDPALFLVPGLGLVLAAGAVATMGRAAGGPRLALLAAAALVLTPFFLRRATLLYPETVETGLALAGTALAWGALRGEAPPAWRLVAAGVLAGLAITVRQTTFAIPAALCLLLLLDRRAALFARARSVAAIAAGVVLVVAAEAAFHWALTGDPLWRLRVDLGHVTIQSSKLAGETFSEGLPLLNPALSARWQVPGLGLHWTVDGLLRLVADPAMLPLLPLAAAGAAVLLRGDDRARTRLLLALPALALALTWLLNTFVLSIAPNSRYYAAPAALLALPAGAALLALPAWAARGTLLLALLWALALPQLQPFYGNAAQQVAQLRAWAASGPHRMAGDIPRNTLLLRLDQARLDALLREGEPAVGETLVVDHWARERAGLAATTCSGGDPQWPVLDSFAPRSPLLSLIGDAPGLAALVRPVRRHFEGAAARAYLLRRMC